MLRLLLFPGPTRYVELKIQDPDYKLRRGSLRVEAHGGSGSEPRGLLVTPGPTLFFDTQPEEPHVALVAVADRVLQDSLRVSNCLESQG